MEVKIRLNSVDDTQMLAEIISEYVFPGIIIGLTGDLGSGKTTFTKYLSKYIGVSDNLNSPTFTILKIYDGNYQLYHMDVYRLEDIGYDYELDEFIYGDGICVIEWYPYIQTMLPKEILSIDFRVIDEFTRDVTIKGEGTYEKIVKAISNRYSN
ncbi:MAG: tRNA (adenosine(37)-N6)-threonylcarbamoyltransferase complex ATPase subunit type 1 TsaE [Candidatus Izemoplasmatales bacterium]|nr:tRNA (adenosine(37)-N6)-threonylcarbamoyltransferase complex ATPase subunit type 1 TsaE [Candidatus Izemoplasmatales bacterium]